MNQMTVKKNSILKAVWLCYFITVLNYYWIRGIQLFCLIAIVTFTYFCLPDTIHRRNLSTGIWYFLFVLYVSLSFLWNRFGYTNSGLYNGIVRIAIFSMCLDLFCSSKENVDFALDALVISGFVFAIHVLTVTPIDAYGTTAFGEGVHENRNYIGQFLSLVSTISFVSLFERGSRRKKLLYIVSIIVSYAVACLSGSRKAIIMFPVAMIVFACSVRIRRKKIRIIGCIVFAVALAALLFWRLPFLQKYYGERLMAIINRSIQDASVSGREKLGSFAILIFKQYPIFGAGCDGVRSYLHGIQFPIETYAHNNYLELLADYGVVGLILFYSRHITAIVKAIRDRWSDKYSQLTFTFIITMLVMDYGQVSYQKLMYILMLVIVCAPMKWKRAKHPLPSVCDKTIRGEN